MGTKRRSRIMIILKWQRMEVREKGTFRGAYRHDEVAALYLTDWMENIHTKEKLSSFFSSSIFSLFQN